MNKKFFNIAGSGDTATIFLYGDIGECHFDSIHSMDIVRELKEAEAAYKKIDVRINCIGGDVFSGIAIFNALRASNAEINIYVDGIAASMGSVIALCGKPVKMSKYSRLMIHCASGGGWGTKDDLKKVIELLESLDGTICEMYAKKTGMTAEEIKATYLDGHDHWLTADEALSIGFINGIYDAEPVPVPEGSTTEQMYQIFSNRLKKPQIDNNMNLDELRKRPHFKDCATDEDVLRIVGKLETEAGKVPGLTTEVQRLTGELKVFQDKAVAEETAAKKKMLDDAIADGRINETQRPTYQAILDKDRENGEMVLNSLNPKRRIVNQLAGGSGEKSPWEKRQEEIRNKK
ncbi:head maturation protease, ClpP-related [Viscerimonas tarda]